jgi:hypothetical protein
VHFPRREGTPLGRKSETSGEGRAATSPKLTKLAKCEQRRSERATSQEVGPLLKDVHHLSSRGRTSLGDLSKQTQL